MEISELSSKDWKVCKYIKRKKTVTEKQLIKIFGVSVPNRIHKLIHTHLITFSGWEDAPMELENYDGVLETVMVRSPKKEYVFSEDSLRAYEDYYDNKRRTSLYFWIPITISIILSAASLAVSVLSAIFL